MQQGPGLDSSQGKQFEKCHWDTALNLKVAFAKQLRLVEHIRNQKQYVFICFLTMMVKNHHAFSMMMVNPYVLCFFTMMVRVSINAERSRGGMWEQGVHLQTIDGSANHRSLGWGKLTLCSRMMQFDLPTLAFHKLSSQSNSTSRIRLYLWKPLPASLWESEND